MDAPSNTIHGIVSDGEDPASHADGIKEGYHSMQPQQLQKHQSRVEQAIEASQLQPSEAADMKQLQQTIAQFEFWLERCPGEASSQSLQANDLIAKMTARLQAENEPRPS